MGLSLPVNPRDLVISGLLNTFSSVLAGGNGYSGVCRCYSSLLRFGVRCCSGRDERSGSGRDLGVPSNTCRGDHGGYNDEGRLSLKVG